MTDETNTTLALQNLQAAIACSLRLPPERIQIRNVTVKRPTGVTWVRPPPAITGNGTVICYRLEGVSPANSTQSRQLTASSEGVAVDYTVSDPPDTLLALSSSEMTTTLTTSPMFQEAAAGMGVTSTVGISATTDSSFAAVGGPASQPTSEPTTTDRMPLIMGGIGAALGILAVSAAVILGVLYVRRAPVTAVTKAPASVSKSHTVVVLNPGNGMQMNPMAPAVAAAPERMGFEPVLQRTTRTGV